MPSTTPAPMGNSSTTSDIRALANDLADLAREAVAGVVWRQWAVLGATGLTNSTPAADGGHGETIIDPEALLLASLILLPYERRLADFLYWWAGAGSSLLSVQRTRTLLTQMPEALDPAEPLDEALAAFAASASGAGDRRWRRHAGEEPLEGRPGKGNERPELSHPSALLLRLRAGFGVSAKADLLAVLLGLRGRPATVKALAEATGYSTVAVRMAAEEMVLARFIEATGDYPMAYQAPGTPRWAPLLLSATRATSGPAPRPDFPAWGYWPPLLAFLLGVAAWGRQVDEEGWSAYVASSKARDLAERHGTGLRPGGHNLPRAERHRGADYLLAFEGTVRTLAAQASRQV